MTTVFIVIGLIILAALVYLATQQGAYTIERSLIINAPVERVYRTIIDFKSWPHWSPWLLHEPDARLDYSANYQQPGGYYRWEGKLVGAGKLTHLEQRENAGIEQRIEIRRPFKSSSRVAWTLIPQGEQTEVHWIMQGNMPFLFRFMTRMMKRMIEKDYDLGLHLLNGYLDSDNPHPQIRFLGEQTLQGFSYLHQSFQGDAAEMVEAMSKGFPDLAKQASELQVVTGKPLTLYFKADPVKMYFECDMAIPLDASKQAEAANIKHFDGGKYYKVELKGDYQFIELAWYKAYCHLQMSKLKVDKKRPALEVYESDPRKVENMAELETSIYVPLK